MALVTTGALRRYFTQNKKEFDPRKFLTVATSAMHDICKERFEAFGSAGYAKKIPMISCDVMAERYKLGSLAPTIKQ